MSKKALIVLALLGMAVVVTIVLWRGQAEAAKLEAKTLKSLSHDDIGLIVHSQSMTDPETVSTMKENHNSRQIFLKRLRESLALGAEARREGLAEDPAVQTVLEHKRNHLLQVLYISRFDKEALKALVTRETMDAVWNDNENELLFARHIEAARAAQKVFTDSRETEFIAPKLEGEKLKKARNEWAVTKILSDKAKADESFIGQPMIALRLRILEAGILAAEYTNRHWRTKIKASDDEIKTYLANHPEYDLAAKRQRAEDLLRRVMAGEDFGKLATEYSEDRGTKEKGGLFDNVGTGVLWSEVESEALILTNGQIAARIIESHNGYHIVKLENKLIKANKDGTETVNFRLRHIMLQKAFEDPASRPGVPPPFLTPNEIAKAQVENEKFEVVVADLIKRYQISLPEDFVVS